MTEQQINDRVALAIRKNKDNLTEDGIVNVLINEKANVIQSSGLLNYIKSKDGGLEIVGGYDVLKKHIKLDKPCFSDKAIEFGIKPPKGILMVGVPGCGKTLLSEAIASEFKFPLIALDVGSLMSKYVGESEQNMREAIKIVESIAPCVLQLDEVEKGFGGAGDLDGGSSQRVFGTFLKWLNDRTSQVYVVATANNISNLPPEFCRKGRFDEVFGLDLPNFNERKKIFEIHIKKRNRNPNDFDLEDLSQSSDGYTGSDIEQSIEVGLKIAFSQGEKLANNHIGIGIESIIPLSKIEKDRISKIKDWCKKYAKMANSNSSISGERKINL